MPVDITIQKGKGDSFDIISNLKIAAIKHQMKDVLNDIANELEESARRYAPEAAFGDSETSGELKANPVAISTSEGLITSFANEAEGFRSVRGEGGRFVAGKGTGTGHLFYAVNVTYPVEAIPYVEFVRRGTGLFGPHHTYIVSPRGRYMKFVYQEASYRAKRIRGQRANPYLDRAVQEVNTVVIPIKIRELRAEVDAIT